jgi:hypothetical protein
MPITKSSTWTEDTDDACPCCLGYACGCGAELLRLKRVEKMLNELLAVIHRDGGQYTTLAGLATSLETASYTVTELYRKNAALRARVGRLVSGGA